MSPATHELQGKHLFTPGPVMVSDAVKRVAEEPSIGHRRPQFEAILEAVREKLLRLCHADETYTSVVVSGSGTAANETVINSLSDASVFLMKNGEFGRRLEEILRRHDVDHNVLEYDWGERPVPGEIAAHLDSNPEIDVVATPYHETSTSMINPVAEIGTVCHERGVYLYADCISAVGGEAIDVVDERIDVLSGVSNKAIGSLTGCSFVCVSREFLDEMVGEAETVYLDLAKHVQYAEDRSQTPNTPAVTSISALDIALTEILEGKGLEGRLERYRRCASVLRDGIDDMEGLSMLLDPDVAANTLTSVFLPDDVALDRFVAELDDRGYVVYPGKGPLNDRGMFQVGNMGEIYEEDCRTFLTTLEETLVDLRSGSPVH